LLKRAKRRYLVIEIESPEAIGSKEFMDAIWNALTRLYGEYGASRTSLTMIDYEQEKRIAIIRAALVSVNMVRAAIASVTRIGDKPVALHVLRVSGTLRSLR
jgi:RNase P/RNase MRP subunit POP5